jgi:hypothetical protein
MSIKLHFHSKRFQTVHSEENREERRRDRDSRDTGIVGVGVDQALKA